ncbi:MAG TPA: tetratricopeptide repeat protein, partial [Candidatus Angelobacter sp.]|nr:tetratricopeptide repeat protein [Candidatus Angelobacter sp.]
MRRIAFAAVALCLALGLGWLLVSKNDKPASSQETEKPSPANPPAQTSSAPTLVTPGVKPSTTQTTTPTQTSSKVLARPAAWALGAGNTQTHKLYEPGEGLPAAMQGQIHGLVQQATSLEDKGDLAGAIDANKKVVKLDPKAAVTMNVIAGLYGRLGDFHSEADWTRKAIALDPKFTGAYINLGNAMGSAGRPAEARKAFGKVMELDPKSP